MWNKEDDSTNSKKSQEKRLKKRVGMLMARESNWSQGLILGCVAWSLVVYPISPCRALVKRWCCTAAGQRSIWPQAAAYGGV